MNPHDFDTDPNPRAIPPAVEQELREQRRFEPERRQGNRVTAEEIEEFMRLHLQTTRKPIPKPPHETPLVRPPDPEPEVDPPEEHDAFEPYDDDRRHP